jgi:hypothetical protein
VSPGATVSRYHAAAFVPVPSGLTVADPEITWSLIPSFGQRVVASDPKIRGAFVSFSQNSRSGGRPSGPGPTWSS